MGKFNEVYDDTQAIFDRLISKIDSLSDINIKILSNNKLKEITKVVKANDLLKHMTNEDVVILINERIFEQLEDEQKAMIVEESVAKIYYDMEKDKLTIINPDISGFSLVMTKYGLDKYIETQLLIKELFSTEAAEVE